MGLKLFGRIVMTEELQNIIALMIGIAGIILLLWADWRVAMGVVLLVGVNNRSILLMVREEVQERIHLLRTGGMRPKPPLEPVDPPSPAPPPARK
jgi:hypothetical protein